MTAILATGIKPSFVFWDRVYRKITAEDEIWLVRATQALMSSRTEHFASDSSIASSVAAPILYVALESKSHVSRKAANQAVTALTQRQPETSMFAFTASLQSWLSEVKTLQLTAPLLADCFSQYEVGAASLKVASGEGDQLPENRPVQRLQDLLRSLSSFANTTSADDRSRLLARLCVAACHPLIGQFTFHPSSTRS